MSFGQLGAGFGSLGLGAAGSPPGVVYSLIFDDLDGSTYSFIFDDLDTNTYSATGTVDA